MSAGTIVIISRPRPPQAGESGRPTDDFTFGPSNASLAEAILIIQAAIDAVDEA